MRLIYTAEYQEEADVRADMELTAMRTHTGLDTLGSLVIYNDFWSPEGDDAEARVEMGIDMKMLARDRGMYFNQPLIFQKPDELYEFMQLQIRRKGWEGNYLWVPAGWTFVDAVDILAIEDQLLKWNFIHLPTPGDEESWTKEMEAQAFEPLPTEGIPETPHFGRLEAFMEGIKTGHCIYSNGGRMKAVVKKA